MRIGVDAREISGHVTGVGRVLNGLLREWSGSSAAHDHDFVLYSPEPLELPVDSHRFRTREVAGGRGTWWEQVLLPKAAATDRLDVLFSPAYTAPVRLPAPSVVAIYDLSYVAHPEWYRVREGIRRRWLTRRAAANARAIVTLSEFSRGEIVERLGVPIERVHLVVPGIDHLPVSGRTAGPGSEPRILYVGSIFNRRHVGDLVRAVGLLARSRPAVTLDIVGDDRTFPREDLDRLIDTLELAGRVRWHRFVSDAALAGFYGRARACAFLSEYEGLGMTPLEGLTIGVPPVVYDTPVARESYGDAAIYAPIGDIPGVAAALDRALFDEQVRASVLSAAPATLGRYDWPRAAREMLSIIEGAV